ncbi:MAG: hypothetical protein ACKPKO_12940, partial [Candidatus Fonsibacter sp.]
VDTWAALDNELDHLGDLVMRVRSEQGNSLVPLSDWDIEVAAKRQAKRTGQGVDALGPADILDVPDYGRAGLADLVRVFEEEWSWPWQLLLNVCHSVAKPQGGDRAIATAPYCVRLWGMARRDATDDWCEDNAAWWDDAVARSSALRTALSRCLRDEAAHALGLCTMASLVDIKGLYGHISMAKLFARGLEWGYPCQVLSMSLGVY